MKILVDADACPVVSIVEKIAKENSIAVTLFCDTSHILNSSYSEIVTVSKGMDAVDFVIVQRGMKGDIVVTQDYGVAAMALGKGLYAIHQSGKHYTNENIDQMMFERHLAKKARRSSSHFHGKGPKKRTAEDDEHFEQSFRRLIKDCG
ncbi:MAG: YaiI/YqxD family protein [Lachnotalea sp.]